MDDEDHRADDPVVREEFREQPEMVSRQTRIETFDDAPNPDARERYSQDAQRDKRKVVLEKKRRHRSYEKTKPRKSQTKKKIKKSLRPTSFYSFFDGDKKKGKRGEEGEEGALKIVPIAILAGVAGMFAYTFVSSK